MFRSTNADTTISLANAGLGGVFIPECGIKYKGLIDDEIIYLSVEDDPLYWDISISRKADSIPSPQCLLFQNHIAEFFHTLEL